MADLLRQAVYNRLAGTKTRTMPSGYRKTQPPAHWFGTNLGARSRARLQSFKTELLRYESISGWPQSTGGLIVRAEGRIPSSARSWRARNAATTRLKKIANNPSAPSISLTLSY